MPRATHYHDPGQGDFWEALCAQYWELSVAGVYLYLSASKWGREEVEDFPQYPEPTQLCGSFLRAFNLRDRHKGSGAQLHTMRTSSLNSHKSHQDVTSHIEVHHICSLIPNKVLMADISNQSLLWYPVNTDGASWSFSTESSANACLPIGLTTLQMILTSFSSLQVNDLFILQGNKIQK